MKVRSPLTKWGLPAFLALVATLVYAAVDQGYENAKRAPGQSNPTCPTNPNLADSWGFTVSTCECVSYVAYRLNLNDVRHGLNNEILFGNDAWGTHFGHAYNWDNAATAVGVQKDNYPAVGSVAHWERMTTTTADDNVTDFGHVAYVQHLFTNKVSGKLDAIGVMEYNYSPHQYTYRKLYPGKGNWPTNFLHFEEKGRDKDDTNVTCVAGLNKNVYKPSGANDGTFCWKHHSNTNTTCESASARFYLDYQTCTRYSVGSSYCQGVADDPKLPGYKAKIGSGSSAFPEPIDSTVKKTDFAFCDGSTSSAQGNSKLIAGRTSKELAKLWRDITTD